MKVSVLVLMSLAIAAPVAAQEPGSQEPAAAARPDPKAPDTMRCRSIPITGSLVKKEKICKTNAEWAAMAEANRKNADDLITRSRPTCVTDAC